MTKEKIQTRCNMYLDEENVATIKDFLKGTGMTFSSYVDLLIKKTANTISDFYINLDYIDDIDAENIIFKEENGKLYFDINVAGDTYIVLLSAAKFLLRAFMQIVT